MRFPAPPEYLLTLKPRPLGLVWQLAWRLAVCVAASLPTAQAQDVDYVVKPGDNPWDFARQHLKPGRLDALLEHNSISNPYRIVPGTILHIPNQWLFRGSRPVKVVDVTGDAHLISSKGKDKVLRPGDQISPLSHIRTLTQGSVTLQFSDGSRTLVRELSDVRLQKNSFVPLAEGRDIRLTVPAGKVENDIQKQESRPGRFEIKTPSGVAAVRGTRFRLASLTEGTRTEVLEGKVAIADQRGSLAALPAGYGMVMQNGRNGASKPLLAAPQISEEMLLVEQLPIDLPLQAIPGAIGYRTLISAQGLLAASLSDQQTETAVMRIRDIPDGDYQLRVRAIDRDGLEGKEALRPVTINARPNAPFLLSPTAEANLSASRPTFSWARHSAASSYHFQLATNPKFDSLLIDAPGLLEPSFQPAQDLEEGQYYWHLATVSATEGKGPFSPTETFRRIPAAPGNVGFSNEQQALRWQKQTKARYHVQVATDAAIEKPEIDRIIDDNQLALNELDAGNYFVRIQTQGESGLTSPWTDVQSFTVDSRFDWRYLLISIPLLLLL